MSVAGRAPSARGSSNEQDAAVTPAEVAVRTRPPRSTTVKALRLEPVPASVVEPLVAREHYLHSMPAVTAGCFGVYLEGELVGALVLSSGPRSAHRLLAAGRPGDVLTLARLWLADFLPKNSESRVIAVVLRTLRRQGRAKLVLSYADPAAGHTGTIYRAAGFRSLGQTEAASYIVLPDGRAHHPRSVYDRFGSNGVGHLRATGVPARRVSVPGKHRYAYLLDPSWAWRLKPPASRARPIPSGEEHR